MTTLPSPAEHGDQLDDPACPGDGRHAVRSEGAAGIADELSTNVVCCDRCRFPRTVVTGSPVRGGVVTGSTETSGGRNR